MLILMQTMLIETKNPMPRVSTQHRVIHLILLCKQIDPVFWSVRIPSPLLHDICGGLCQQRTQQPCGKSDFKQYAVQGKPC